MFPHIQNETQKKTGKRLRGALLAENGAPS